MSTTMYDAAAHLDFAESGLRPYDTEKRQLKS